MIVPQSAALRAQTPPAGPQNAPTNQPQPEPPPVVTEHAEAMPVYRPPSRGIPGGRIGGAARGTLRTAMPLPSIDLAAPADHTGLTANPSTTLYYFVSQPVPWPMQLTIAAPLRPQPVVEATIPSAQAPGIYSFSLSQHGVQLQPGMTYTWSVSIVIDPHAWSRNIVASATIAYAPPDALSAAIAMLDPLQQPANFAAVGLWYDAVASAAAVQNFDRHVALERLLDEVGLVEVAKSDRLRAR
jgi:hypothetical protein